MRLHIERVTLVVAILAGSASAAPRGKAARKEFDKGVAAYQKGDFAAAAAAFARSDKLESDAETLFAWAQSERKLDHCDKAIDLYNKLLATDMPAENKEAVKVQIGECNDILAQQKPASPDGTSPTASTDPMNPTNPTAAPTQPEAPKSETPEGRAWWKDPVGGALVGVGVIGIGMGVVFLVQGHAADQDKANAKDYPEFVSLDERATSRGRLGVISLVVGGAAAAAGVVWYQTHKQSSSPTVTGWLDSRSGGIAISGGF